MTSDSSSEYLCALCRREFPFEHIRYSDDGKRLVCTNCYTPTSNREEQRSRKAVSAEQGAAPAAKSPQAIKYICNDCRYKFVIRPGSRVRHVCPYCGKNRLVEDAFTADMLLEEAAEREM